MAERAVSDTLSDFLVLYGRQTIVLVGISSWAGEEMPIIILLNAMQIFTGKITELKTEFELKINYGQKLFESTA